jgi:hypothetical protein
MALRKSLGHTRMQQTSPASLRNRNKTTPLDFRGIKVFDPRLAHLQPVFRAWQRCIQRYVAFCAGHDAPYWYNERANVSVLAGAAWTLKRFAALEEYSTIKGKGAERGPGRVDLWLSSDKHEWVFEAKFRWVRISHRLRRAVKRDASVLADAQRVYDCDNKGVIIFYVPWVPRGTSVTSAQIESFISTFLKQQPLGLVAWSFPATVRGLKSRKDNHCYPGILLTATLL